VSVPAAPLAPPPPPASGASRAAAALARVPLPARAVAAGLIAVVLLLVLFPPGRYDVPALRIAGTAPIDETYWSSPVRERMGAGRLEPYDHGLALSLALPQNALGALAAAVGASVDVARHAGSIAAVFALAALAVLLGGLRGVALASLLLAPFAFGHLATDLAEGPALALVVGWLWAADRGRWAIAAAVAGVGVFQKGCGLFLGVGCIAAVLSAGNAWPRRLLACALGAAAGVAACVLAAVLLFHDDPLAFLVRPWTTTAEVRSPAAAVSGLLGHLVQAAFAAHHGAARALVVLLVAALFLAPRARVAVAALAALAAGWAFLALFPDPQRLLPLVPLLVLPAFPARGERAAPVRTRGGLLLAAVLAPQAAAALVALFASRAPAVALAGAAVVMYALAWRFGGVGSPARWGLVLGIVSLGSAVHVFSTAGLTDPLLARAVGGLRGTALRGLADEVAARVPPDAGLVASPVLGLRHRGTLWYVDFRERWRDDLARARPSRLFRVRSTSPGAPLGPAAPPPGYAPSGPPALLGTFPYAWDSHPVDVWLEEHRPAGPAPGTEGAR
jgi:hypothetical protein